MSSAILDFSLELPCQIKYSSDDSEIILLILDKYNIKWATGHLPSNLNVHYINGYFYIRNEKDSRGNLKLTHDPDIYNKTCILYTIKDILKL